jgi:hypothetical protein
MDITLSTVTDAARQRRAAVTAEAAGYLVLLVVQQVAAYPCHVRLDGIFLTDAGDVVVRGGGEAGADQVELELRRLLIGLLALAQSVTPALRAAAERSAGSGLHQLEAELLAALIPINHAAARRALARLYRETQRATSGPGQHLAVPPEPDSTPTLTPTPSRPSLGALAPVRSELMAPLVRDSVLVSPESERRAYLSGAPETARSELMAPPVREGFQASPVSAERAHVDAHEDALEIDVDIVEDDPGWSAAPAARSKLVVPIEQSGPTLVSSVPAGHCSDVSELLASFLSYTRSEERMTEALRKMLGVDAGRAVLPMADEGSPPPRSDWSRAGPGISGQ